MAEMSANKVVLFFKSWWMPLTVLVLYLATHLPWLTSVPIFADEAIYIRWAQLIIDEPARYAFFPLNDGKTPLFMWLLIPFQFWGSDHLWSARLVSALIGLAQVASMAWLVRVLGGRTKTAWWAAILTTTLPFWFWHHRMALIDGLLALWLTLATVAVNKVVIKIENRQHPWLWVFWGGLFLGLGLWTKLPMILFWAVIPFWLLRARLSRHQTLQGLGWLALMMVTGVAIFGAMKLHPAFGQLFSRGGDFLYPVSQVLFEGKWQDTLASWPNYLWYMVRYLTWPILLLVLAAPFSAKMKRIQLLLLLSAAAFAGPIMMLGVMVYPRYLFPAAVWLTASAALMTQEVVDWLHCLQKNWAVLLGTLLITLGMANALGQSAVFLAYAWWQPDAAPLVAADRVQYQTEWSSGHGILETVLVIQQLQKNHSVAVATEGYFGTLPDALLVYFHRQDVSNLYIEGIGQPVAEVPDSFISRASQFDQVLLVVNSHRLVLQLEPEKLLYRYCRPYQAPCLEVWDITELVSQRSVHSSS